MSSSEEGVSWDQQSGFNIFAMLQAKEADMESLGYETKEKYYEALDKEFEKLLEKDPNFSFETSAIGGIFDMPSSMSFSMVLAIAPLDNFKYVIDKGHLKKESWMWLLRFLINSSMSPNYNGIDLDPPIEYLIDKCIEDLDKSQEDLKSFMVDPKEFGFIQMIMESSDDCSFDSAVDQFCEMVLSKNKFLECTHNINIMRVPPEYKQPYQILKQGEMSLVKFIENIYEQNGFYFRILKKLRDIGCE